MTSLSNAYPVRHGGPVTIWDLLADLFLGPPDEPFIGPRLPAMADPVGTNEFHDAIRAALTDEFQTAVQIKGSMPQSVGAIANVLVKLAWNQEAVEDIVDGKRSWRLP